MKPITPATPEQAKQVQEHAQGLLGNIETEVSHEASGLYKFVHDNAKVIAIAVIAIIAAILIYGLWQNSVDKKLKAAQNTLGTIVVMPPSEAKIAALEKYSSEAPKDLQKAILQELAISALALQNLDKAAKSYEELAKLDSGAFGMSAEISLANIYYQQGKAKEAMALLEKVQAGLPKELQIILNEQLGASAEAAGEYDKSIAAYEQLMTNISGESAEIYRSKINSLQAKKANKTN